MSTVDKRGGEADITDSGKADITDSGEADITYSQLIEDPEAGQNGWLTFAGLMLMLVGTWNLCEGILELFRSAYFIGHPDYGAPWFWATALIGLAVLELATGFGIMAARGWARLSGIAVVGLSALTQLFAIGAYPVWSLFILGVDLLILYALTVHWRQAAPWWKVG